MSLRELGEDRKRPPLIDRIMLWLSAGRSIDGLWIGSYFQKERRAALRRVEEALRLIKTYDRLTYDRLIGDLDRIWVRLIFTGVAQFHPALRACFLDERFLLADTTDAELVAAAIVHEATHARLWNRGIRYDEAVRQRVEAICMRREVAFARKLPSGDRVRQWAEDALTISASYWTNAAAGDRDLEGRLQVLQHLETKWLARIGLALLRRRLRKAGHQMPP